METFIEHLWSAVPSHSAASAIQIYRQMLILLGVCAALLFLRCVDPDRPPNALLRFGAWAAIHTTINIVGLAPFVLWFLRGAARPSLAELLETRWISILLCALTLRVLRVFVERELPEVYAPWSDG